MADSMATLARELGIEFKLGLEHEVQALVVDDTSKNVTEVITASGSIRPDVVVAGADYHHVEQHLLPAKYRNYNENEWDKFTMSPSRCV